MKTYSSVTQIPRNDVKAAMAFIEARMASVGRVSEDVMRTLYMLQDDPEKLRKAVIEYNDRRRAANLPGV